ESRHDSSPKEYSNTAPCNLTVPPLSRFRERYSLPSAGFEIGIRCGDATFGGLNFLRQTIPILRATLDQHLIEGLALLNQLSQSLLCLCCRHARCRMAKGLVHCLAHLNDLFPVLALLGCLQRRQDLLNFNDKFAVAKIGR